LDSDPSVLKEGRVVSLFPRGRNGQGGREAISHFGFSFSFSELRDGEIVIWTPLKN
jgi:hypothetical protein